MAASRVYRTVHSTFWTGTTGREIGLIGGHLSQLLALYLITSPHQSMIGLCYMPLSYISADTGMTSLEVEQALDVLERVGFCRYDHDTSWCWVVEGLRYQAGYSGALRGENRIKGMLAVLEMTPSAELRDAFIARYRALFDSSETATLVGGSPDPAPTVSGTQTETETKTETETEVPLPSLPTVGRGAACGRAHREFQQLWNDTTTPPIVRCTVITEKRRRAITARLHERPLEEWRPIMARVEASEFCRGLGPRGWVADIDWFLRPDTAVHVLEGRYDNRAGVDVRQQQRDAARARFRAEFNRLAKGEVG